MIDNPRIASIPIEERWIDEAGEDLAGAPPALFLSPFSWNAKPTLKERIAEIKRCIRDPDHPLRLDDLAAHLDGLKGNGRQVVFLWRLKAGEEAYLGELSRRHSDRSDLVWEPDAPVLAEIRHLGPTGDDALRFKWVASRRYFVAERPAGPNAPPVFEPRVQRAVTFFRVDLRTGDCELRIQSLPFEGQELPSLRQELDRYRSEVEKLLDLNRYSPVLIEPIASLWLRETYPGLAITRWGVILPTGKPLYGGGNAGKLFSKLKLFFGAYFARHVTLLWDRKQKVVRRPLYFSLDGTADSVEFNGLADASRVDFLLETIRRNRRPPLRLRELRLLAEWYPEHARIWASLDHRFAARKGLRISVREVAAEVWYDLGRLRGVFALAAAQAPKAFSLEGDDLILRNRIRIREGGVAEALERYATDKGFRAAGKLVKPAMTVVAALALYLYRLFSDWLLSTLFQCLTGIPLEIAQIGLAILLAVLHVIVSFGGASVKAIAIRLVGLLRSLFRRLKSLPAGGDGLLGTLEVMYQEWLAARP